MTNKVLEQTRKIGKEGRLVGKIGYGAMGLTTFYGDRGTEEGERRNNDEEFR